MEKNAQEARTKLLIEDLNLYYGDFHALHGINMDIKEKEITAFIGPSGCGKSTLLKSLNRMNDLVEGCRIEGKVLLLVDPMLATGSSMELAYKALLTKGTPKHVHVASIIASQQAVDFVQAHFPDADTTLWVGAIDAELNAHSYIVPGLGDAGDLAYGVKE